MLLSIESAFLSQTEVKAALQLSEINKLKGAEKNAQKKKFATSCALSKLVAQATEWYFEGDGKTLAEREGITWNKEEFASKVFGWQKSYYHKLLRTAKLDDSVIDEFNTQCDSAEAEGKKSERTIEGLLKFSKAIGQRAESTESEGETAEGDGDMVAPAPSVERVPVMFVFTYKAEDGSNVSVRVNADGSIKTANSPQEVLQALELFTSSIKSQIA